MKALWIGLTSFLISLPAFASQKAYEMEVDISVKGKPTSQAKVIVLEGEKATVTQKDGAQKTFFEITAKDTEAPDGQPAIHLDFVIGTIEKDGTRSVVSRPRIITLENEKASITMGNEDGSEELALTLVARRKSL